MGSLVATLVLGGLGLSTAAALVRSRVALARHLAVAGAWLLAALSLVLLFAHENPLELGTLWIPGTEPISLSAGPSSAPLIVMAQFALALAVTLDAVRHAGSRPSHFLWLAPALCGLVVAGLAVDQFLARYAALEALALLTVVAYALEPTTQRWSRAVWGWYWQFRLGDAGLLLLILALHRASGTFLIDPMLAVLPELPVAHRLPLLAGGLLASWVKLGLPPFHGWLAAGAALRWWRRMWVTGIGLPLLAGYLLYRLGPAVAASGLRPVLLVAAALSLLVVAKRAMGAACWRERATWLLAAHGAAGVALAGSSAMPAYLLTLVPIRALLAASGAYTDIWSHDELAEALSDLGASLEALVRLTAKVEERLESLLAACADAAWGAAAWMQRRHTGRLRANLLWACLGVLAIVVASMTAWSGGGAP